MTEFRELTMADLDQIYEIEVSSFEDHWTLEQIKSELTNNHVSQNFGLFENKIMVAYILCHFVQNELHINNVAVATNERRKGFASTLIRKTLEKLNPETAFLEVDINNIAAIRMYENLEFRSFYTRKNYYKNGSDALVMIFG